MMKKVCLLLLNGFEALEASVFTDVLGWNLFEGDGSTEVVTVGTKKQLKCTWNFTVIPETLLDEVVAEDFDALAIPGGFEEAGFYEDGFREEVAAFIRKFDQAGKPIATVCVASLLLGHSGVLMGRNGTTYNLNNRKRQHQLAAYGVNVMGDQSIVVDKNVITSFNPSTAMDVAFLLLEKLTNKDNCNKVKHLMGF